MTDSLYIHTPGGFGDNLMATAVISAIQVEYPDTKIFVATRHMDIFDNNPAVSGCYHSTKTRKKKPAFFEKFVSLKYPSWDKLGESKGKKHIIDYYYDSLPIPIENRIYQPQIYLSCKETNYRKRKLQRIPKPLVAISPYGGLNSKVPNKFYPAEKWPAIVSGLIEEGVSVIQLGKKKEGPVLPGATSWFNIGYRKSGAVLLHCEALITHPSGFMHLATALDIPCLNLLGGVEDAAVGGYNKNLNLTVELDCAPCWRSQPCENPRCKDVLSPKLIVAETMKVVKRA